MLLRRKRLPGIIILIVTFKASSFIEFEPRDANLIFLFSTFTLNYGKTKRGGCRKIHKKLSEMIPMRISHSIGRMAVLLLTDTRLIALSMKIQF